MSEAQRMTEPDARGKLYVLFADDDPDTLAMLCAAGKQRGWTCDTANRAREVLEKFNQHCASEKGHCYDAVVMDLNFRNAPDEEHEPRLTGVTAAKEIRRAFLNVPIIFYSGAGNSLVKRQAENAGGPMSEFFTKPGDLSKILDRVEYYVRWADEMNLYEGPERRRRSINRTPWHRRASDKKIEVPQVLEKALAHARSTSEGSE